MADLRASITLSLVDRFSAAWSSAVKQIDKIGRAKEVAEKRFAAAANLRQAAEGASAFGAKIRELARSPIDAAMAFEKQISRVRALGDSYSELDMAAIAQESRRLGASTIYTSEQAAEGFTLLAQSGFSARASIAAMGTVLDLAAANDMDLARATEISASVLRQYGADLENVASVQRTLDVLTATTAASASDLTDLGEAMSYAGVTAAQLGVSIEDTAAMAGLLANLGVKGSMAGTTLRTMMASLTAMRGRGRAVIEGLDISLTKADGSAKSVVEQMREIADRTKDLDPQKRAKALVYMFGREPMAGIAGITQAMSSADFDSYVAKMTNVDGATRRMAATMLDNGYGATVRLSSALDGLKVVLGEQLLPRVRAASERIGVIVTRVTGWAQKHPALTKAILTFALVCGAAATAIGGLLFAMSSLVAAGGIWSLASGYRAVAAQIARVVLFGSRAVPVVDSLGMVVGRTGGSVSGLIPTIARAGRALVALFANPIGIVILAVAALGIAIWQTAKHWDALAAYVTGFWDRFQRASIGAKIAIVALLSPLLAIVGPLVAIVTVGAQVVRSWGAIKAGASAAIDWVGAKIEALTASKAWRLLVTEPLRAVEAIAKLAGIKLPSGSGALTSAKEAMAGLGREVVGVFSPGEASTRASRVDLRISYDAHGMPIATIVNSSGAVSASAKGIALASSQGLAFGALY
jgi:TP901 family phage tail tape measure protein